MSLALGVNIDHIATLRQARRASFPDPLAFATLALACGADYIVAHLRRDRRHIQEEDLKRLCKKFRNKIHLECSYTPEMQKAALALRPYSVCIVPELPGEVTTTGGLKFTPAVQKRVGEMTAALQKKGVKVSLFVSPAAEDIRTAAKLGADIVELCTRDYSEATTQKQAQKLLQDLALSTLLAKELGLEVHAGHGLDYTNVLAVADIGGMACMNIGFAIIARALEVGLPSAVAEMKELL
ncbi:pyridoxine 5'-phosphate synthase [Candidatus Avelusimicrobium faecicola]|uniref:pyridoxine 5'-phosphate synthase n=1 Tax=Candidatus Avelusimicrobium faecicola TaxID=3416205 RepID=UPI0015A2319F|nr:pyridoxine 5'-phosphate synthase [Spirochaetota bacterium]